MNLLNSIKGTWKVSLFMTLFWSVIAIAVICLCTGCALIPSNESKTANAKTAGNMEQEHEKTIRAFAGAVGTNGGSLYISGRTLTRTTDSEKWDYSFTRSIPFLIAVGAGLLLLGIGGFVCLRLWKAAKAASPAIASVSNFAETQVANIADSINAMLASASDPIERAKWSRLATDAEKARGKVKSFQPGTL